MLDEIVKYKYEEVKRMILLKIERETPVLGFSSSLEMKPFILEIKKKSPSIGELDKNLNVQSQATLYEKINAGCISVLADEKYFLGGLTDITLVKKSCSLPVLCKEFIVDEIQIENAYLSGADAILLIVAIHSSNRLSELYTRAKKFNLDVLFEIHDYDEFEKIKHFDLNMVGVNSRNLKTMEIDLNKCALIIKKLSGNFKKVAESGIKTKEDITLLKKSGANAFLIGTTIMSSKNKIGLMKNYYGVLEENDVCENLWD